MGNMNYNKEAILAKVALFEERLVLIESSPFHQEEVAELKAEILKAKIIDLQHTVKGIIKVLRNEQA